jgi:NitT/TauT family transport system substrate-binding protein
MKNLLACLLALTLFISSSYAEDLKAPALQEVTIAEYGEFLLYANLYIAYETGLFEKQGLKVKIVSAGGDEKVFAALVSGSAQFGVGDPTFVAISGERGRPGKIIYSILQNIPAWGITFNPEIKPFTNAAGLKDYSVATYPAPATSFSLQKKMFKLGNLEPNIVQITYGGLISALAAKKVDIALEYEPNVSLALEKGAHKVFSMTDYYPEFALTGLSVLPEYLDKNPEIAQKITIALQRATYKLWDFEDSAKILSKRFPEFSVSVIKSALLNAKNANSFPENGMVSKKGWDEAIKLRRELGDLKSDAPYEKYVITKFAENAIPRM